MSHPIPSSQSDKCKTNFSSVRIATAGTTSAQATIDNLLAATPLVIANIDDGWDNVLSIGIKTSSSVLLPIWNSPLEGRFDKPAAADVDMTESESKSKKAKGKGKEKKRGADEIVEEQVEKKAKASPKKAKDEAKAEVAPAASAPAKKTKVTKADKVTTKTGKKTSSVSAEQRSKKAALGKSKPKSK